jgi:plastocyanin
MIVRKTALAAGIVALGLGAAGVASVSAHQQASNPTAPERHVVLAGLGDGASSANMFSPKYIDVYAGDTVTWRIANATEPHTVTFGPKVELTQLAKDFLMPLPQKAGPPLLAINPEAAKPTLRATYDGTGLANSGILARKGQSWSLTFTKPGTYHYVCLVHGEGMSGEVVVHPRPAQGHLYLVQAGDSLAASQDQGNVTESTAFFPRALTIHEGDTVEWIGGFHTVTFGPDSLRTKLENNLFTRVRGKNGAPQLVLNPQVAYPSGGTVFNGSDFVNSGLLFMRAQGNQPPTYRLTFTKAGTYEYDCLLHKGMDGIINVLPKGA